MTAPIGDHLRVYGLYHTPCPDSSAWHPLLPGFYGERESRHFVGQARGWHGRSDLIPVPLKVS